VMRPLTLEKGGQRNAREQTDQAHGFSRAANSTCSCRSLR
jgi:hypothetical protein